MGFKINKSIRVARRTQRRARRTYRRSNRMSILSNPTQSILPNNKVYKLKLNYQGAFTWNATNILQTAIFQPNNMNAPIAPFGAHQARGYDQLTTLYGSYRVLKYKAKLTAAGYPDAGTGCIIGIAPFDSSNGSALSLMNDYLEWKDSKYRILTQYNDMTSFNVKRKNWDVQGVPYRQYMDEGDFGAVVGSAPTTTTFLHVYCGGLSDSVNPEAGKVDYTIEFVYHVLFTQPKQPAAS